MKTIDESDHNVDKENHGRQKHIRDLSFAETVEDDAEFALIFDASLLLRVIQSNSPIFERQ